jgi:hypothetical protein
LRDATVASLGWYNDKKNNGQNKSNGYYFYEKLYQLMEDESYAFFIDAVRQDVLSAYNLAENIFPKYEKLVKRYNELQKAESEGLAALVTPTEVFNRLIALAKENASPRSLREVEDGEYQEVYKITPKIIETVFKSLNTEYEPVSNVQDGEQIDPLESGEVDPTGDTGATDQKVQDERKLEKERIASLPVDQVISELPTAVESVYSRLELFRTGTKLTPNLNGLIDELETVQSAYESEKIKVLNEKEQKDLRFMISSADLALRDQVEKLEKIAEVALNKLAKVREDIDAKLLKQKSDAEKDAATVERLKAERAEADQVSSDTDTLPDDF